MKSDFRGLLKDFGVCRILLSLDFAISLFCAILIVVLRLWCGYHFDHQILHTLISTFGSLFGLIFTAFAIFVSFSDSKFISILKKANIYEKLMFPFWYVSILYLLAIMAQLFAILLFGQNGTAMVVAYRISVVATVFFTVYSLMATFYRIAATVKIGLYRAAFSDKTDKESTAKEQTESTP